MKLGRKKAGTRHRLLLAPHMDHLFDRGYISFDDDGRLMKSTALSKRVWGAWQLQNAAGARPLTDRQREYLAYHREYIFRKKGKAA